MIRHLLAIIFTSMFCLVVMSAGHLWAQPIIFFASDPVVMVEKIFKNECHSPEHCFMEWNEGENFLSLGLGHFIWYPESETKVFDESFPDLLEFIKKEGGSFPAWLDHDPWPACPWSSRESFALAKGQERYQELEEFLQQTKNHQAEFILYKAQRAIMFIDEHLSQGKKAMLAQLLNIPQGMYAIVDYINFKGAGLKESEKYHNQGWGLLQVLEPMEYVEDSFKILQEFGCCAKQVLTQRALHAPAERGEDRWLPGWLARIDTYGS